MVAMLEAIQKCQKMVGKSMKHRKHGYDSSSDSNSEEESGYSNTGLGRDKHLK